MLKKILSFKSSSLFTEKAFASGFSLGWRILLLMVSLCITAAILLPAETIGLLGTGILLASFMTPGIAYSELYGQAMPKSLAFKSSLSVVLMFVFFSLGFIMLIGTGFVPGEDPAMATVLAEPVFYAGIAFISIVQTVIYAGLMIGITSAASKAMQKKGRAPLVAGA